LWLPGRSSYSPHQAIASVVDRLGLGVKDFLFQGLQGVIVELELQLEGAIRHPPTALEHRQCLVEDVFKGHSYFSTL
jgi:hypothetical protein